MPETTEERLRRITDHAGLLLVSRLAMAATPLVASVLVYVGGLYLEARFTSAQDSARLSFASLERRIASLEERADNTARVNSDLSTRMGLANQAISNNGEAWRTTSARLDKMTNAITGLTATVAALDATIKAQR